MMYNGNKRGQVSAEFIIILSILFLLLVAMFMMYNHQREYAWLAEQQMDATLIANSISNAMVQVTKEGTNASTTLFVPTLLSHGQEYTIYIDNSTRILTVFWDQYSKEFSLPTSRVVTQNVSTGTVTITNEDVITIA